jgi:hypothetical protein
VVKSQTRQTVAESANNLVPNSRAQNHLHPTLTGTMSQTYNANPTIFSPSDQSYRKSKTDNLWLPYGDDSASNEEDDEDSPIDDQEIFGIKETFIASSPCTYWSHLDLIRSITDPEHPLTLEELKVVSKEQVKVEGYKVSVEYTPTSPACGMANVIGKRQQSTLYFIYLVNEYL